MKLAIWFFFHRIYAICKLVYLASRLVANAKDTIAFAEVRIVTKKQLDDLEDAQGREATPTDFENIPETKVEVSNGPQAS